MRARSRITLGRGLLMMVAGWTGRFFGTGLLGRAILENARNGAPHSAHHKRQRKQYDNPKTPRTHLLPI